MKEIGSEFWDVPQSKERKNSIFPRETGYFLSGRHALSFIIEDIQIRQKFKSVLLPNYCCETMIEPFLHHGVEVSFYPVYLDEHGKLKQELPTIISSDAILVMDYFGYGTQITCPVTEKIVIRDVTHSVFSATPQDGDYVYGSLRKWAGFLTGGFAWHNNGKFISAFPKATDTEYISLRQQAMQQKKCFLTGTAPDKSYLAVYENAESLLDKAQISAGAEQDCHSWQHLDRSFLKERRNKNANYLWNALSNYAMMPKPEENDCPLFFPIVLPEKQRDALRKHLIEQQIYCPIHWPVSNHHKLNRQTETIYRQELSIPCDQRYGLVDMERVVFEVICFLKKIFCITS